MGTILVPHSAHYRGMSPPYRRPPPEAYVLRDCASRPKSGEASIAQRMSGLTEWFAGEFVAARAHVEQALEIFDPERDGDLAVRLGQDVGVSAMAYSALTLWALGEVDLARLRAENMAARTAQLGHAAPAAYGLLHAALFELMRGDRVRGAEGSPLVNFGPADVHTHARFRTKRQSFLSA